MHSRSRADAAAGSLGLLPTAAIAVAEGAWIAVLESAVAVGLLGQPGGPGFVPFALAAGLGMAVGRRIGGATFGGAAVAATVAAAALIGWLIDPAVRAALAAGDLQAALAANPAGLLVGLAAWRGTRYRDRESADLTVTTLLTWGIPGLAIPWLIGTATSANHAAFAAEALPATLLFVAAGLAAIGLLRLDAVSRAAGEEWRARREWPALIGGVVVLVLALGVPAAILLDVPLGSLVRTVTDPVLHVGETVGQAIAGLAEGLETGTPPAGSPGQPPPAGAAPWLGGLLALVGGTFLAGIVALAVVAFVRLRPAESPQAPVPSPPEISETHRFVLPGLSLRRPRTRLPRLGRLVGSRPAYAVQAYLALLEDRAEDPATARRAMETPAAHARRLRLAGRGSWRLDLLAADYALARYAGRRLSAAEDRRAVARWRRLRRGWPGHRPVDSWRPS